MLGFLKALTKGSGVERHPQLAQAARCLEVRDYTAAEILLSGVVAEADRPQGSPALRIRARLQLAGTQRLAATTAKPGPDKDRLELALNTIGGAIEIAARASDVKVYIECLDMQSVILADLEQWTALESVQVETIRLAAAQPNAGPASLAARLRALGVTQGKLGRAQEALGTLEHSLQLHEQAFGPSALETAEILSDIAAFLRSQRASVRAVPYLKRALQIQEASFGGDSPQALQVVEQLAAAFEVSGNLSLASQQYERALQMKLRKLGIGNLDEIAEMQYGLAQRNIGWNNLTRARELLSECIGGFQRRGGPRFATALETLAQVEMNSGHFSSAAHELERASVAWERCGPSHSADLVRILEQRAALLDQLHRERDAKWLRERAAEINETLRPSQPVVRKLVRSAT